MSGLAVATTAAALAGLAAAALVAAVVPGRDPLGLSERGRTAYVYAAEVLLALLCMHLRLTMPWLFSGWLRPYWPLVVMFIAFCGVGISELFRRQGRMVLAEPLENTGAFLPLLPALGYMAFPSAVDYSLLLLCAGVLYAAMAVTRRSFAFGVMSALAVNGSLWSLLADVDGLGLFEHPQVWIIPPSLSVLAAGWLNREQLGESRSAAIRYGASAMIYASSTADVFLNGVAQAPWLPLILAGISLAGIFAGIMLRVRAFLFLGTAFLLLSLFTIIWHAAVDLHQVWLWYATVVAAGIVIVVVFAVFEKKRQEVLHLVDKLKDWRA